MENKIEIEKVTEENFHDFLYLINKLAEYEKKNPPDVYAQKRLMDDYFTNNPKYFAYLGKIKGSFIGYVVYYFTYSSFNALPILHIEDLFVLEDLRKKGFGQSLFDFCIEKAKEKECDCMEWTVYDWNKPAIKFYIKNKAARLDKSYYQLKIG